MIEGEGEGEDEDEDEESTENLDLVSFAASNYSAVRSIIWID
jgi:hypothetical protein